MLMEVRCIRKILYSMHKAVHLQVMRLRTKVVHYEIMRVATASLTVLLRVIQLIGELQYLLNLYQQKIVRSSLTTSPLQVMLELQQELYILKIKV